MKNKKACEEGQNKLIGFKGCTLFQNKGEDKRTANGKNLPGNTQGLEKRSSIASGIKGLKRANHPDKSADIPMLNKIIPQTINLIAIRVSKNPANVIKEKPAMVRTIPDTPIFFRTLKKRKHDNQGRKKNRTFDMFQYQKN